MIIVQLKGGLGNQMFQYAFGRYLAEKNQSVLKLDTSYLLDRTNKNEIIQREFDLPIFNIKSSISTARENAWLTGNYSLKALKLLHKGLVKIRGNKSIVYEPHFQFSEDAFNAKDNSYIIGYWQSERYFKPIELVIRKEFTFVQRFSFEIEELHKRIKTCNSICLNVRRADFVGHSAHDVCTLEYFKKGIEYIREQVDSPRFFVFSDDIEWCKQNLAFGDSEIVTHNYAGVKFSGYLYLMSSCRHFIIPNSSFAWWAVWLNTSPDKIVVAPDKWFRNEIIDTTDLVPASWHRIKTNS